MTSFSWEKRIPKEGATHDRVVQGLIDAEILGISGPFRQLADVLLRPKNGTASCAKLGWN